MMESVLYEVQSENGIDVQQFWKAIKVFIEKPHVVNRALCDVELRWVGIGLPEIFQENVLKVCEACQLEEKNLIKKMSDLGFWETECNISTLPLEDFEKKSLIVLIRKAIPKNVHAQKQMEVVLLDQVKHAAIFVSETVAEGPKILPEVMYSLSWLNHTIKLTLYNDKNQTCLNWLKTKLLPRIGKWAEQTIDTQSQISCGSLQHVDISEYNELYQQLKSKYSNDLISNWQESTDPLKFVYEDLAIASYLILIWRKQQRDEKLLLKQTFLDMGCGNGLLVYILSREGYKGTGIDLRSRKIWETFSNVDLQEETLDPSDSRLFPNYDWLIGNHSDELTPWIPVIAMKSSYKTNFFVLPCCPFDFYMKFQRKNNTISLYKEYLDFVVSVTDKCQFNTFVDKLRIPSTKRTCIVSTGRKYGIENWPAIQNKVDEFVNSRKSNTFKPRDTIEPIRNCTNIDELVKLDIVKAVVNILLEEPHYICITRLDEPVEWNKGRSLGIGEIAKSLSYKQLQCLKKGCGGLQTFLKNHPHVFAVRNAVVSLKVLSAGVLTNKATECLKTKDCWFYSNHPNSCILMDEQCPYRH